MSDLKITLLSNNKRDIKRFLNVSYDIYRDDPNWVAPMLIDMQTLLSPSNPFFQHAEMSLWVVSRDGRDVGRIAGILDRAFNDFKKDAVVFFGFYEVANDPEASRLLFDEFFAWAARKKMKKVLGPMNPSTNDACGMLVDGFDEPPVFMMPYNPPYYPEMVEGAGFDKAIDLLAYTVDSADWVSAASRLDRVFARFRRAEPAFAIRPVTKRTLASDLLKVREIYNDAWADNWGFMPMTDAEIGFMAERLKPLLTEGMLLVAEVEDAFAGFILMSPDYNQAFRPLKGRLLSPRILKLIPYLLGVWRPSVVRIMAMGVQKRFRHLGVEAALLAEAVKFLTVMNYSRGEMSWILENNAKIQNVIKVFRGRVYKTYRIYARDV